MAAWSAVSMAAVATVAVVTGAGASTVAVKGVSAMVVVEETVVGRGSQEHAEVVG